MKTKDKLLEKYYNGETTTEEEKMLQKEVFSAESGSVENEIFGYFRESGYVPADLEESLFRGIQSRRQKRKIHRVWLYSITSAAASVLIVLGAFLGNRAEKYQKMENDFFVMEQALFRVSESLQPDEENEMLVLWVDENVEIIIY
jgi:hypothetical protein